LEILIKWNFSVKKHLRQLDIWRFSTVCCFAVFSYTSGYLAILALYITLLGDSWNIRHSLPAGNFLAQQLITPAVSLSM
jgi:hypothetical protein